MYFNAIYNWMGLLIQLQQHIKIMDYINIKHVQMYTRQLCYNL
jgi:hypothetical protein